MSCGPPCRPGDGTKQDSSLTTLESFSLCSQIQSSKSFSCNPRLVPVLRPAQRVCYSLRISPASTTVIYLDWRGVDLRSNTLHVLNIWIVLFLNKISYLTFTCYHVVVLLSHYTGLLTTTLGLIITTLGIDPALPALHGLNPRHAGCKITRSTANAERRQLAAPNRRQFK